jgi:CRISPR/Cas system-associated exonuclease Cas4 (RecB family)
MIDFDKMIENYVKREHRPKGAGRYFPSEIGTCMRKVWYSYKYPQEIKPELQKIFELGNMLHDYVVKVLRSEKNPDVELLKSEFPFHADIEDFTVAGRIDNLILLKVQGKEVLVEVKSTGNVDFVEEAMRHNIMQLQLYMHFIGVHDGILLYVDKRNLKSKVFTIKYSEKAAQLIIERFRQLHSSITQEKIPDPEARASRDDIWMCRYCEYRDKCYEATPKDAKWM